MMCGHDGKFLRVISLLFPQAYTPGTCIYLQKDTSLPSQSALRASNVDYINSTFALLIMLTVRNGLTIELFNTDLDRSRYEYLFVLLLVAVKKIYPLLSCRRIAQGLGEFASVPWFGVCSFSGNRATRHLLSYSRIAHSFLHALFPTFFRTAPKMASPRATGQFS